MCTRTIKRRSVLRDEGIQHKSQLCESVARRGLPAIASILSTDGQITSYKLTDLAPGSILIRMLIFSIRIGLRAATMRFRGRWKWYTHPFTLHRFHRRTPVGRARGRPGDFFSQPPGILKEKSSLTGFLTSSDWKWNQHTRAHTHTYSPRIVPPTTESHCSGP